MKLPKKKQYNLVCADCKRNFAGEMPSIRYCFDCRTRTCKNCQKVWQIKGSVKKHTYDFCSQRCANTYNLGNLWKDEKFQKKMHLVGKIAGKRLSENNVIEEKHPRWTGDDVSYNAVHKWVAKHMGKANKCSECLTEEGIIHWSNISGKYQRDLSDWQSLCVKCHSKFDRNRLEVIPTIRQQKLAEKIIENISLKKPLNKGELLESVGYATNTQKKRPGDVIMQKGVKKALEVLGFDEEKAKRVVAEIMLDPDNDPSARLKATDQVFKVHGSYAPEKKELTGKDGESLFSPEHKKKTDSALDEIFGE